MVNNQSVHPNPFVRGKSELPWGPPDLNDEASRLIPFQVWDLEQIKAVAENYLAVETGLFAVTDKCGYDIQNLGWTLSDVATRVMLLRPEDYDKSIWCQKSTRGIKCDPATLWLPCDAYSLKREEFIPSMGRTTSLELYLKMSLNSSGTGLLFVSVHY